MITFFMTITAPNTNRQLNYLMRWLVVGIAILAIFGISAHGTMVKLRRAVSEKTKQLEELRLANAQLKNEYYTALDTRTLLAAGERLGYLRDNNPTYLTFRADGTPANGPSVSLRE